MEVNRFLDRTAINVEVLETWIAEGWLMPRRKEEAQDFDEVDVARAELIRDLRDEFGVNDEGVAIILDLVDQIHGVRRALRAILSGVAAEPESTRRRIVSEIRKTSVSAQVGSTDRNVDH
jgi:chaperone modulatory protein CbpM